jgi:flagellar assembly protein FliH
MSSRIYGPGEPNPAETLIWPQVCDAGLDASGEKRDDPEARLAQLQREADHRVNEARKTGYQEGLVAAKAEAAASIKALDERLAKTIAELTQLRPRLRRQAETDLVKLSLAIARRILHRELAVDPEALRGLIQAALEKLQSQEICRVRVHPAQEPLVRSMLGQGASGRPVELVADKTLDRGAAIFETNRGNLDASAETQLLEIEQGLTDRLRGSS